MDEARFFKPETALTDALPMFPIPAAAPLPAAINPLPAVFTTLTAPPHAFFTDCSAALPRPLPSEDAPFDATLPPTVPSFDKLDRSILLIASSCEIRLLKLTFPSAVSRLLILPVTPFMDEVKVLLLTEATLVNLDDRVSSFDIKLSISGIAFLALASICSSMLVIEGSAMSCHLAFFLFSLSIKCSCP